MLERLDLQEEVLKKLLGEAVAVCRSAHPLAQGAAGGGIGAIPVCLWQWVLLSRSSSEAILPAIMLSMEGCWTKLCIRDVRCISSLC